MSCVSYGARLQDAFMLLLAAAAAAPPPKRNKSI